MTTIEWTEKTWNPTTGCSRVSAGCDKCYAVPLAVRFAGTPAYRGTTVDGDWSGQVNQIPARLAEPFKWSQPSIVFVNSMSDLFHPAVDPSFLAQTFATMAATPRHTYQVLTKRPKRMRILDGLRAEIEGEWHRIRAERGLDGLFDTAEFVWPIPNVWLGTSIEDQAAEYRRAALVEASAAVRFLSVEPLIGPVRFDSLEAIDWVIVGGESGHGSRPMAPEWADGVRRQCEATGVAFFFKQWGNWRPAGMGETLPVRDVAGEAMVREASKHFVGYDVLDGREHKAMPAGAATPVHAAAVNA